MLQENLYTRIFVSMNPSGASWHVTVWGEVTRCHTYTAQHRPASGRQPAVPSTTTCRYTARASTPSGDVERV